MPAPPGARWLSAAALLRQQRGVSIQAHVAAAEQHADTLACD
ncbi:MULTISPECIES: hypothetical protein [Mycetohabitans]|nr:MULTISPECIES: hypothetical protein [Mycetohabitans]